MWIQILLFGGVIFIYKTLLTLYKSAKIPLFLALALTVSFTLWYLLPILLSNLGYWYIFEGITKLDLEKFNYYASCEIYFFLFTLLAFAKIRKWRIKPIIAFEEGVRLKSKESVLIVFSILMILYRILKDDNYSEINDVGNANNGILYLFSFFNAYIISYFYINIFDRSSNRRCTLFLFLVIISVMLAVFMGARIYLIVFVWLYLVKNWKYVSEKKYLRFFSPLILLLLFFSFLLPIMAEKRAGTKITQSDMAASSELILYHLNLKLNSVAYSTALIEYDGEGFAGYDPYVGSMLKFFPRAIWKTKPTPLSYNGTVEGTPTRRIPELLNFQDLDTANVGVSAFLVSLWQGWGFVFIALVINSIYLCLIAFFLCHFSFYIRAIGFYLLCFPQLITTPSSGDNLIQRMFEIPILLLFLYFLGIIRFKYVYGQNKAIGGNLKTN